MAYFAVNYLYRVDADVAAVRPTHRAYLATLRDEGKLIAAGPLVGTQRDTALLIFCAPDADACQKLIAADPMSTNDIIEDFRVTEWNPATRIFDN